MSCIYGKCSDCEYYRQVSLNFITGSFRLNRSDTDVYCIDYSNNTNKGIPVICDRTGASSILPFSTRVYSCMRKPY